MTMDVSHCVDNTVTKSLLINLDYCDKELSHWSLETLTLDEVVMELIIGWGGGGGGGEEDWWFLAGLDSGEDLDGG